MVEPWWATPFPPSFPPAIVSQPIQSQPKLSESSITEQSESTPAKRRRTASKEKQPPAGRLNAPKHANGRYRPAKESLSKPIKSVLALSLPPRRKSHPLGTNEQILQPVIKTAVEITSTLQQVIKTPVYQNLATSSHISRTQQPHDTY